MASITRIHFFCMSGGDNMNAGTLAGDDSEPTTAAVQTCTGGDWNSGTRVYTCPVGTDMTSFFAVGRWVSIYHDGDTAPTSNQYSIGQIESIDTGARTLTIRSASRANLGTGAATGTGNRSLKLGGGWAGPSGASGFPLTMSMSSIGDGSSTVKAKQINLKNDQTYSMTAVITCNASMAQYVNGYSTTVGDSGRATIDGGTSGASYNLLALQSWSSGSSTTFTNIVFKNNGATGSANLVQGAGGGYTDFVSCVFTGARGAGMASSSTTLLLISCEFYSNNASSTANSGGLIGNALAYNTIFHDNTLFGWYAGGSFSVPHALHCIFDSNSSVGFTYDATFGQCAIVNCDFYNNGSNGITGYNGLAVVNCNFVKNGGYGISNSGYTLSLHCGFGNGTQVNSSGDYSASSYVQSEGEVQYPDDETPWANPANGDFRITHSMAKNAGYNEFTQVDSGYGPITTSAEDIGAARHNPDTNTTFIQCNNIALTARTARG